jgi:hypothetical protein
MTPEEWAAETRLLESMKKERVARKKKKSNKGLRKVVTDEIYHENRSQEEPTRLREFIQKQEHPSGSEWHTLSHPDTVETYPGRTTRPQLRKRRSTNSAGRKDIFSQNEWK